MSGDLGGGAGPGSSSRPIDALAATLWQVLRTAGLGSKCREQDLLERRSGVP